MTDRCLRPEHLLTFYFFISVLVRAIPYGIQLPSSRAVLPCFLLRRFRGRFQTIFAVQRFLILFQNKYFSSIRSLPSFIELHKASRVK